MKLQVLPSDPCEIDFSWYNMIRNELLRKTVPRAIKVLDVGCRGGEVLFMLQEQIEHGIGIDISKEDVTYTEKERKKRNIKNLEFIQADAKELPFASGSFDVVLCLGDVLSYSNLYAEENLALSEIVRVLTDDGLTVHECMNWDWEYRLAPYWTFFMHTQDGRYFFHRNRRTVSGLETSRQYEVLRGSPLHDWVSQQNWPVSPQGERTSLDVREESPIPRRWLMFRGVSKHQNYTPRSLKRRYQKAGFRNVQVFAYGQTYDIASKAGLLETVGHSKAALAKAEAELAFKLCMGSGPWLFLVGRKRA